jgi:hypothetical protein
LLQPGGTQPIGNGIEKPIKFAADAGQLGLRRGSLLKCTPF